MRTRIKNAIKVASSSNILAARYAYIQLMKDKKKKKHSDYFKPLKYYIKFFGQKKYITKQEAQAINYEGVCIE